MNKLRLEQFNLHETLLGGQTFGWDFIDGSYYGFTQRCAIKLEPDRDIVYWQTYPESDREDFIKSYLRFNEDYNSILNVITQDPHVEKAIQKIPNFRLLNQGFEETLLSFILSANNNIPSIRKSIRVLNEMLGDEVRIDRHRTHLFPPTERIAEAKLEDLLKTKIGFRAKYLKHTAQSLVEKKLSSSILNLPEDEARTSLTQLYGVGNKVADCVLSFSLKYDNVTPIDVWVKRILSDLYGLDPKLTYDKTKAWIQQNFHGYAAWAVQWLFEYYRREYRS